LKIISSRPNGDGITLQSCENYTVSNCFVRSWDDSLVVKNYAGNSSNITFKNMQLWTDLAQSMEIGYETNKGDKENASISDITFEDITVLNNFHKPVISVHNADDATIKDVIFKNIIIENAQMGSGDGDQMPYLIDFNITDSSNWSTTKERGQIENVVIDGVKVLAGKFNTSRINGFDETHIVSDVTIKNLEILGEKITSFEQGKFEINEFTKNLTLE
jgi:polygalacturonase